MDRAEPLLSGMVAGVGARTVVAARRPAVAPLRSRLIPVVATTVALVTVGIVAMSLLVWVVRGFGSMPVSFGRSAIGLVGLVGSAISYASVGAVLALRVRGNPIGWLFLVTGLLLALMLPVNLLVASVHDQLRPAADPVVAIAWLRTTLGTPGVVTLMIVAVLLFPTGRPINGRWWAAVGTASAGGALLALYAAVNPDGLISYPTIRNPLAAPAALAGLVDIVRLVGVALLLAGIVLATASIGLRYRTGGPVVRAQLRWIVLAVATTALAGVPFLVTRYLLSIGEAAGEITAMLAQLGSCSIPIAAAFAATRYRLYEVDLLIGRTLVYVPLTAILAGFYAAFVTLFQRIFVALTGEPSDLAILFTLVLVTSVLTPVRKWLEKVVEQRFATAARTWAEEAREAERAEEHTEPSTDAIVRATAAPAVTIDPATFHVVDHEGRIACPVTGRPMDLADCLSCGDFDALVRTPAPAIVCRGRFAADLAGHNAS